MEQNKKITVGIVGCGILGSAIAHAFMQYNDVKIYDTDSRKATHSFTETINQTVVFLCLPTPMKSKTGGDADLTIINTVFDQIVNTERHNNTVYVVKSTTPVGTVAELIKKYAYLKIVHNPEFLTSRTADIDFLTQNRIIIGDDSTDHWYSSELINLYKSRFPSVPIYMMKTKESEMVKYMCNTFFATKIMFFNEMKMFCDKMGLNWQIVLDGMLKDGRIALSHTKVPGNDGIPGFSNVCVPPNAKVKIFPKNNKYIPKILTIEEFYNNQKKYLDALIESANGICNKINNKNVIKLTKQKIKEDIICIRTKKGVFKCTKNHLIPILRDNNLIILEAKDIKITDLVFCKH